MCTWPNKYSALTGKLIHQVAGHPRHNTMNSVETSNKPSNNTSTVDRDAWYYM
jgi:hypothetical protein